MPLPFRPSVSAIVRSSYPTSLKALTGWDADFAGLLASQPPASSIASARLGWEAGKLCIKLPEALGYAADEQLDNRFAKRPEIGRG